jgi:hypothetical protein
MMCQPQQLSADSSSNTLIVGLSTNADIIFLLDFDSDRNHRSSSPSRFPDNPCFDTVRRILETDKNLTFMKDIHGDAPLSYVKKESHAQWIDFLTSEFDQFWPADGTGN